MENASNALIIAGGVLIGVLILSLAVYLFADFGSTSAEINKKTEEQQLVQFNSKFTTYESTEKKWTVYDVVTVAGYARENNKYYTDSESDGLVDNTYFENNYKITVRFESINGTTDNLQNYSTDYYNNAIQDDQKNVTELPRYSCNITYHDNGMVKSLIFKK